MGKHTIFVMLILTVVWVILVEELSWQSVAVGMFMSMLSVHFMGLFFKFDEIKNVKFYKLAIYPFWLIGRIYMDAFSLAKLIFTGAKWGIVKERLELDNETLNTILADSITLTPGTIFLYRKGKEITLLCIGDKKKSGFPSTTDGLRDIEKILKKAHDDEEK